MISDKHIASIVDRVVDQLTTGSSVKHDGPPPSIKQKFSAPQKSFEKKTYSNSFSGAGCFATIEEAIEAATQSFYEYKSISIEQRKKIIANIREVCLENLATFAQLALNETGLGRLDDKIVKNEVAITKTPGVEDLEPTAFTGDYGLTLFDYAPYGVIGSITPSTNPSETIINNTISMIAGGNSVVFNPHPGAKKVSTFTVDLINKAIISAGGPPNLIATIFSPTIDSANTLMKHGR